MFILDFNFVIQKYSSASIFLFRAFKETIPYRHRRCCYSFFPDGSLKSKEKCLVIIFVRNFQNLFLRFFSPCVSLRVLSYIKFVLYLSNVKFAANFAFTRVYTFYFSFFSIYFSFIPKSLQFKFCLIVIVCCFFVLISCLSNTILFTP